jgi:hypothetical protein
MHCWVTYKNQHCALGYVNICLLLCSSYMFQHLRAILREHLCPCELRENWDSCVGPQVTWTCVICVPVCGAVHSTEQHHKPAHRSHKFKLPEALHSCLSFHVTHKDKDTPWGWHAGAETCTSCIAINIYGRNPVHSVGFYTYMLLLNRNRQG